MSSDSQAFEIRPYQAGDEEGIVELLKLSHPHWVNQENALATWKWQFTEDPSRVMIAVGLSVGKIICVMLTFKVNIKLADSSIVAAYGGDVATHPDYRKLGVYSKVTQLMDKMRSEKGIQFVYASSSHPAVIREWIKRNRVPLPFSVDIMVRIKDIKLHLERKPMNNASIIQATYSTLKILNQTKTTLTSKPKQIGDLTIDEVVRFDARIDAFWDKVKEEYDFILERKSAYLNWKYCDHPTIDYKVKQARSGEDLLGYIVYTLRKSDGYSEGYIIDLLTNSNRLDVANALYQDACDYFDDHKVNTAYCRVVNGHPYQSLSARYGFIAAQLNKQLEYCDIMDCKKEFEVVSRSSPDRVIFGYSETL